MPDSVSPFDIRQDVKQKGSPPSAFNDLSKLAQFALQLAGAGTLRAVSADLDVDGRGKHSRGGWSDPEEVLGLLPAGPAEGEEVIRADFESRTLCLTPIALEAGIDEIAPFARLHVRELDVVAGDRGPVDLALMPRDVNPIALTVLQAGPEARNVVPPPKEGHERDTSQRDNDDQNHSDRPRHGPSQSAPGYSHSMVPGGFDVTSRTTRFTPLTSLTMRREIVSTRS